ncbi:MAG: TetR/AcrR family transcriptional regulator [Rhodothermales bacterium]|nr:TetR/AcrR family transcriptional regulator [Rhodothermales bacterium]MBO6780112.1 TetR/AcrR family transcriptional regulator [Rhodothermales bacterium]
MPAEPESNGVDLRRLILDETRHLLVAEGYNSLSMRRIAKKIGYSATAIYLHFDSKDALVHTLIDEGMGRLYDRLKDLKPEQGDPAEALHKGCMAYVRFGLDNPEYYEIMHLLHPERMERYPAEKFRRARRSLEMIGQILERGVKAGTFTVESATVASTAIWAMLHGVVSLIISRRVDVRIDQEELIQTLVGQVVTSVTLKPVRVRV